MGRPEVPGKRLKGGFEHGACDGADFAFIARLRRPGASAGQGLEDGDRRLSALQYRAGCGQGAEPEKLRITLAVAGFSEGQIEVTVEENQLPIRGRQPQDKTREIWHPRY